MTVQDEAMELDLQQLMLGIREAAARRNPAAGDSRWQSGAGAYSLLKSRTRSRLEADLPDLKLSPDFKPRQDHHYHVNDLLRFHDTHFVRNAYRAILKRDPDDAGFNGYLERLRGGSRNKIDVLASLRFSPEGRQRKVKVDGLILPATVRLISRVPILGYFLQLLIGILRIPVSIRERRRFESYALMQQQELAECLNRLNGVIRQIRLVVSELPAGIAEQRELTALLNQRQQQLATLLEEQRQELAASLDQQQHFKTLLDQVAALSDQQQQRLATQENNLLGQGSALAELSEIIATQKTLLEGLKNRLAENEKFRHGHSEATDRLSRAMEQVKIELAIQQARAASLLKAIDNSLPVAPPQAAIFREEDSHLLDGLFLSLEEQFRGTRSEIKERFQIYLPYLQDAGITSDVVDVGCGRGEWLELLKETGIQAEGVDANRLMVDRCLASGLKVAGANAIDFLAALPDNALSAVTSFHCIEHLEFKTLVELINEIVRVLRPGGLLILETPNPDNIIVGTSNFYLDPTHRHPLPIQMMKFLLEAKGLSDLRVLGLHTLESSRIQGDSELIDRFNEFFYGPMDYAIIARRN